MTIQETQSRAKQLQNTRSMHEVACSINLSLVLTNCFFILGPTRATDLFFNMDRAISRRLGLLSVIAHPKDEYTPGYFAFLVPLLVLAICCWSFLRLFAASRITREFLRSGAGISALIGSPLSWFCFRWAPSLGHRERPFEAIQLYEVLLILVLGVIYLFRNWRIPDVTVLVGLLLHYGVWFWTFGPSFSFGGYSGPFSPAVGLFAGFAWILYIWQLQRQSSA